MQMFSEAVPCPRALSPWLFVPCPVPVAFQDDQMKANEAVPCPRSVQSPVSLFLWSLKPHKFSGQLGGSGALTATGRRGKSCPIRGATTRRRK